MTGTSDACWQWLGSTDGAGYGHFNNGGAFPSQLAHRIAYHLTVGEIPDGLALDHLCRVRICVNPAHLEPVTSRENSRRSPLVLKDSCPVGHPYAEGSYYFDRGHRACKECKRRQVAEYTDRSRRIDQMFTCDHCGTTIKAWSKSRHLRDLHPEHYTPRSKSEGITPERQARRLERQRARRRAARIAKKGDAA